MPSTAPTTPTTTTTSTATPSTTTNTTIVSGTSVDASGKNKSFTVSSKPNNNSDVVPSQQRSTSSGGGILSRFTRANTTVPSSSERSNSTTGSNVNPMNSGHVETTSSSSPTSASSSAKLRSLSCEFIDNNMNGQPQSRYGNNPASTPLKQLDERDELVHGLVAKNLGYSSLNKVDYLRKSFMDSTHSSQCSDMVGTASGITAGASMTTTVVKSVKFKDPPENVRNKTEF